MKIFVSLIFLIFFQLKRLQVYLMNAKWNISYAIVLVGASAMHGIQ